MRYRKFKADCIFDGKETRQPDTVLITDERGTIEALVTAAEAGDDVEALEGWLSPGLINCHCHLELSHMKDIVKAGTGLVDFLITVIGKRGFEQEAITSAMQVADKAMYNQGIVAVGDICNTTDSVAVKLTSNIHYYNFIEAIGFTEARAEAAFERFQLIYFDFLAAGLGNTSIVPHAPYTISKTLFELINAASAGKIISIHNQETMAENELYQNKSGEFFKLYKQLNIDTGFFQPYHKSSLQAYLPFLNKAKSVLLIHNTFISKADIAFALQQCELKQQQLFWCFCPNANLYIENKLPDIDLFINNNCNIILGTDSYSSNYNLDILAEIKTLQHHFPLLETKRLLQWATLNGSVALNMSSILGSFEKGKQPGIVLLTDIRNDKLTAASAARRIL